MIQVYETAIRAWVVPATKRRASGRKKRRIPWRSAPYGKRVLVVDSETTVDFLLRLLYAVFQLYESGQLVREGIILGDSLKPGELDIANAYAADHKLEVFSREDFCRDVFFPEVYVKGTLCVGFSLPFDLSRLSMKAGSGRGKNRRKFRLTFTSYYTNPAIYVETISGRAAFIGFAPKNALNEWEKPFFRGRFLDLAALARALTGRGYSLRRAAIAFKTAHKKTSVELGGVTAEAIDYCRNDVLVTWELYEKLRDEYLCYPFASLENERERPPYAVPMGQLYSTASVAKATLRMVGFRPLFDGGIR